jgi:23S rRNA pseudouridine1911/1915/1917 synthase
LRPGIVHRLDKDTSGLLLVAKNDRAHALLAAQLAAHTLAREYLALVWGHPKPPGGRIEGAIGRSPRDGKLMQIGGRAQRSAMTAYETLESYLYTSWLGLRLETGRTHQIRVHLRSIGHPVVGDPQYGGREAALRGIAPGYRPHARTLLDGLPRQALHAWRLSFTRPSDGENVVITADPPEDIRRACSLARCVS